MSEQHITKSVAPDGSSATVTISGVLKIDAAAELRHVLGEALAEAPRVLLDVGQLEDIDLTILQTVCSACKSAAARKSVFLFEGELPDCMTAFNSGIGAYKGSSCRQNNDEPCTWLGGKH